MHTFTITECNRSRLILLLEQADLTSTSQVSCTSFLTVHSSSLVSFPLHSMVPYPLEFDCAVEIAVVTWSKIDKSEDDSSDTNIMRQYKG